VTKNLG